MLQELLYAQETRKMTLLHRVDLVYLGYAGPLSPFGGELGIRSCRAGILKPQSGRTA